MTGAGPRPFPNVEGVTHRHVEAAGLRFHVAEAGPPDADPVLLLHGWPQHWYMWRHQIPPLARHFRVIAPDMRGCGWSDAPPRGYDKRELAADFLALMDALGLDRVRLIGHDWGGWCGFLMCMQAPERFERFLALNIPPPWSDDPSPRNLLQLWRFWYMVLNASPLVGRRLVAGNSWVRQTLIRGAANPGAWSEADIATFAGQLDEPARAHASVQLYRSFLLQEIPDLIRNRYATGRLTTRTLLMFGTDDFAVAKSSLERDFSRHADNLRVEFVPDCGHFIAEDQPDVVTNRALEFLSS